VELKSSQQLWWGTKAASLVLREQRGVWTYGPDGSLHNIPVLLFLAMLALASPAEQLGLHDPLPPSLPRMDQVGS